VTTQLRDLLGLHAVVAVRAAVWHPLGEGLVPPPAEPLPRWFPQAPDLAADPQRARLTIEHALTMSLGLEWREDLPYNSQANAEIAMESWRRTDTATSWNGRSSSRPAPGGPTVAAPRPCSAA